MPLSVQFYKVHNHLTDEDIVIPRLVNQQSLDFNELCEYLADGSTVTAADVSAVMKQIEMRMPLLLGLNVKVVCSPEGLTFRPKVSGSITQSELKAKLEAKKAAETDPEKAASIDVNRAIAVSDLSIADLVASIAIEMPKKWEERFRSKATFKRVAKAGTDDAGGTTDATDPTDPTDSTDSTSDTTDSTDNTDNTGGSGGSTIDSSTEPGEGD